ncbi:MAG: glycosyltransferase family 2 protein, partial [Deltaproteobacteria bacterium]|nr:glycosyltransferase family 2 protein [Deltaproteobacteria bacterium]
MNSSLIESTLLIGGSVELSVVLPCLDEAETLAICIDKIRSFLAEPGIEGEIIVADNGSKDGSQRIARDLGARVVEVQRKGYGSALRGGIEAAKGTYVIMGDADDSYDFTRLHDFVRELRAGKDLVMGNRFKGGILPGAMPWLHRWIGNPILTAIGRIFFRSPMGDFHCGLRGFRKDAYERMNLRSTGMEFASEMVIFACAAPCTAHRGDRSSAPQQHGHVGARDHAQHGRTRRGRVARVGPRAGFPRPRRHAGFRDDENHRHGPTLWTPPAGRRWIRRAEPGGALRVAERNRGRKRAAGRGCDGRLRCRKGSRGKQELAR